MKRSIPPLCIAVVATVIAVQSIRQGARQHQQTNGTAPVIVPCSDKTLALLNGLDVGHSLADFRVTRIRCVEPKSLEIDLRRDSTPLVLIVAERGSLPHSAPRQTPRHDLFYTRQTPPEDPPTPQEIDSLLVLLAARVTQAEQ